MFIDAKLQTLSRQRKGLRCISDVWNTGIPWVGNGIDNYIVINGRSEAGEVHQISQVLLDKIKVRGK